MNPAPVVHLESVVCLSGHQFRLQIDHLKIYEGDRIAIIGPNGAGKSTFFRLLSGYSRPVSGQVHVLGHALHASLSPREMRSLRASCGQIMQGLHLVNRLTVLENVLVGCLSRVCGWRSWIRLYPAHEVEAAKIALNAVGLGDRADNRTDGLSGGEKQKVAIARLLMQRPRLILADEPTAALDPAAADEVCQLIARAANGSVLISIVHNPALLSALANRVIGLKHGRVFLDLPVGAVGKHCLEELYQDEESSEIINADDSPSSAFISSVTACAVSTP